MPETILSPEAAVAARLELRRRLPQPAMRRALREASGLSASEVAACLGVSRQTVAQWERGVRTPRGDHLSAYVAVLHELSANPTSVAS